MKFSSLNPYSILPLVSALLFLALALFILIKREARNALTWVFASNCLVTFWWQFLWFILFNTKNADLFPLLVKIGYTGITFIPVTFFHFYICISGIRKFRRAVPFYYLGALFFIFILWFSNLYIDGYYSYYWGPYPKAGQLHPLFLVYLTVIALHCFYLLFSHAKAISWLGEKGNQIKYLILGLVVYCFSSVDFLSNYGFKFYPVGVVFILIYLFLEAVAIIKYRLLDIKVAVTRLGIFLTVYTLVLGLPIWVGFKLLGFGVWFIPIALMGFFATAGPFIYLYIQKRAEDRLLQEQRRYQMTLRQASAGMGRIKDLKKLLNLIVYIVTRAVGLEHAMVYVHDEARNQFVLGAFKRKNRDISFIKTLPIDSPLVEYLIQTSAPVVYEEIKQKIQDYADPQLVTVEKIIVEIGGALVFPILIEKHLLAIVVLGKKESGKLYGEDDLSVFSILANQAALAIENAQFYEEMKTTQEQLFQAEKMATIGTMADGLSHQINNRFHALGFIAGDALDTIKINKDQPMSEKLKEVMGDLERALMRVQENVVQGGEVVQGLLRYTRKGDAGFTAVDFDQVFKSAYEMTQFKIKTHELKIVRSYDPAAIPKIKGNFTQLQEVFFNLIDNGYDAMMQRKTEKKEPGYQPTLTITVERLDGQMEIIFSDNGIGVKEEDAHKLFTPFFTTKLSSKKGTGLGLYVIKKVIEENHKGKVEISSQYMVGTQMKLRLPVAVQ